MINKKLILISFSILCFSLYLLFENSVNWGFCGEDDRVCRNIWNDYQWDTSFAPYLLVFSLLVSFLPYRYFEKWWQFAIWALPLSIFLFVGIYESWFFTQSGGSDLLAGLVENVATKLIYIFFVIGSLIQLFRAYRSDRKVVKK